MIKYLNRWEVPQINFYASHHKAEIARKIPISSDLFYEMIDPMTGAHYKKLYAGTIYPSNDSNALGIVVNDYYSYEGEDMNVAICVHGAVSGYKLPITATDEAKTAMKLIEFRTHDYTIKPTMSVDNEIFEPGTKDILTALIILSHHQWLPIAEQTSKWKLSGASNTEIKSIDLISNSLVSVKIDVSKVEFDKLSEDNNKIILTPDTECTTYKGSIDSAQVGEVIGEYVRPQLVCDDPVDFNIGEQTTFTANIKLEGTEFTDQAGTADGWTLKASDSSIASQISISAAQKVSTEEVNITIQVLEANGNSTDPINLTLAVNEGTTSIAPKFISPVLVATVHKASLTCANPKTFVWGKLDDLTVELELENASFTEKAQEASGWTVTATGSNFASKVSIGGIKISENIMVMTFSLAGVPLDFTASTVDLTITPVSGSLSVQKISAVTIATINVPKVSLQVPTIASVSTETATTFSVDVNIVNTTVSDNATNVSYWTLASSECDFGTSVGISSITKKTATSLTFNFDLTGKTVSFTSSPANISLAPKSGALIALPTVSAAKIIELKKPAVTFTVSKLGSGTIDVTSSMTARVTVSNSTFTDQATSVGNGWTVTSPDSNFPTAIGITSVTKKSDTEVEFYVNLAGASMTFSKTSANVYVTPKIGTIKDKSGDLVNLRIFIINKS